MDGDWGVGDLIKKETGKWCERLSDEIRWGERRDQKEFR